MVQELKTKEEFDKCIGESKGWARRRCTRPCHWPLHPHTPLAPAAPWSLSNSRLFCPQPRRCRFHGHMVRTLPNDRAQVRPVGRRLQARDVCQGAPDPVNAESTASLPHERAFAPVSFRTSALSHQCAAARESCEVSSLVRRPTLSATRTCSFPHAIRPGHALRGPAAPLRASGCVRARLSAPSLAPTQSLTPAG